VPLGFGEIGWEKMAPQLAVLVSSPAVMASAWYLLDGGAADAVFKILAFKALFFAILVARLSL
jgi:hypothetical protein